MESMQSVQCYCGVFCVKDEWPVNYAAGATRLHYVIDGEACLHINGQVHALRRGHIYLLPPQPAYRLALSANQHYRHLFFDFLPLRPFVLPRFLDMDCDGDVTLSLQLQTAVHYFESTQHRFTNHGMEQAFLSVLLQMIHERIPLETVHHMGVERALLRIHNEYATPLTVHALAATACMEDSAFIRAFRRVTADSPHSYLKKYRLRQGAFLLREGKSVSETAQAVGFSDTPAFSAAFKRFSGLSPTEFAAKKILPTV